LGAETSNLEGADNYGFFVAPVRTGTVVNGVLQVGSAPANRPALGNDWYALAYNSVTHEIAYYPAS